MVKKNKSKQKSNPKKSSSYNWKKPLFALGAIVVLIALIVLAVKYIPQEGLAGQASSKGVSDLTRCTQDKLCNSAYLSCSKNCVRDTACVSNCLSTSLKATIDKCVPVVATCAKAGVSCSNGRTTSLVKINCATGQVCKNAVCVNNCVDVAATCAATGMSCSNGKAVTLPKRTCAEGQTCNNGVCCGNGIVEAGEECDSLVSTSAFVAGCLNCRKIVCIDKEPNNDPLVKGVMEYKYVTTQEDTGYGWYDYCVSPNFYSYKRISDFTCDLENNPYVSGELRRKQIETDCPTNTICNEGMCVSGKIYEKSIPIGTKKEDSYCAEKWLENASVGIKSPWVETPCKGVYKNFLIMEINGGGYTFSSSKYINTGAGFSGQCLEEKNSHPGEWDEGGVTPLTIGAILRCLESFS